ncbi:hypothetical protein PTT_07209 [Pyrenophora teres f. teres 0-1]|uniref:Uncharacterized protein n=1 Tax=Pyrenophora teres f. teres (strain 0-1) TaxID=861557 RepID=E3RH53_PYRTT|nr:hypothetical protein PTT_07209 [Pyrenophora teres f. teres 0-1]
MRVTIASTAFLMLLGIDQALAKWEGYGCCGVATQGPTGAPAEWCENLPLVENGHRGFMLCCIEASLEFGNGPDPFPKVCQSPQFLNQQYITEHEGMELCESGGITGFKACARRHERYRE